MTQDGWVAERSREFESLRGRRVESWVGVEMALREDVTGHGAQFVDPEVPCLQLIRLHATLEDGSTMGVTTYQDDAEFGLRACPGAQVLDADRWAGIYRWRPLTELPVGQVDEVTVFVDDCVLAEVGLRIGARPLLLIAAELAETPTGRLSFRRLDESILAFTDPASANQVPWATARPAEWSCG
ncbi:MAG TPA: hypothetical protein VFW65_17415 [Pseudonocardiaceae bacterium]|nr:hypothetical protein [Pseudonocardiaceae bacterium]